MIDALSNPVNWIAPLYVTIGWLLMNIADKRDGSLRMGHYILAMFLWPVLLFGAFAKAVKDARVQREHEIKSHAMKVKKRLADHR